MFSVDYLFIGSGKTSFTCVKNVTNYGFVHKLKKKLYVYTLLLRELTHRNIMLVSTGCISVFVYFYTQSTGPITTTYLYKREGN